MKYPLLSKALGMGAIFFLLWLTLLRVDSLVAERRHRKAEAVQSVEQSSAGAQTLMGPLLRRSCTEEWDVVEGSGKNRRTTTEKRQTTLVSTPATLAVDGSARSENRRRNLFTVTGFVNTTELVARWPEAPTLQPQREHADSRLDCGPITAVLVVSDVRGLRAVQVLANDKLLALDGGTGLPQYPRGVRGALPEMGDAGPLVVKASLELIGTGRLALVPAAGETHWSLQSDWPHPSFGGRFLPVSRDITAQGFTAKWSVNALASAASDDLRRGAGFCALPDIEGGGGEVAAPPAQAAVAASCLDTIGVSFYEPTNPYVLTDRATKYAMLFILLTFASVALVEVMARVRVHPVQYTLVGLAMIVFYLLLLSFSEHTSFGTAYAIASGGCVALLSFYAVHILGRLRSGLLFGLGVLLLYCLLWVLLSMEQSALLVGSLILFGALAAAMGVTRRIDWYALVDGWRPGPAARPAPVPMPELP